MSELSDLVAIFGAIDDHVVEHPELVPDVAKLLCPYRDDAAGWFQPFKAWLDGLAEQQGVDGDPVIPDLPDALRDLEAPPEEGQPKVHSNVSRLLLGSAALARFVPAYYPDQPGFGPLASAIVAENVTANDVDAARALEVLADEAVLPDLSWWTHTVEELVAVGLLDSQAVRPPACSGRLVEVNIAGQPHPAAAIQSSFCVENLTFVEVRRFLNPETWGCSPFWCSMVNQRPDPPPGRFLETVSLDCDRGPVIKTCLDFNLVIDKPKLAVLAYRLSEDDPACVGDGEILVDEGSIEVRDLDGQVCITTTKRVLFKYGFSPGWIAGIVCPLGYADMGAQLVDCAAKGKPTPPAKRVPTGASDCVTWIDEAAGIAERCVEECAGVYQSVSRKASAGRYATDDLARDMAAAWKRVCRDAGTAVGIGVRGARVAAAGGVPKRLSVRERLGIA
jgi:hypothetical protein